MSAQPCALAAKLRDRRLRCGRQALKLHAFPNPIGCAFCNVESVGEAENR